MVDPAAMSAGETPITALRSPAGDALGVATVSRTAEMCVMALASTPRVGRGKGGGVERGAMMLLADQCMGSVAAGATGQAWLTLDLRFDWLAEASGDGTVICRARREVVDDRWAFVIGDLETTHGDAVGRCIGQFFAVPHIANAPGDWPVLSGDWPSFEAFLGLRADGEGFRLPAADHLVGWIGLPAFHGGLVAAALEEAMSAQAALAGAATLRRAEFDFLRPVRAGSAVRIAARWVRQGRALGFLEAVATQDDEEPLVTARATVIFDSDPGVASQGRKTE